MSREIWHELLFNAPAADVYAALTDTNAHWWTIDVRGQAKVGAHMDFWFGDFCQRMDVIELVPGEMMRWRPAAQGISEWVGTEIEFRIVEREGKTILDFRHSGWRDETTYLPHCSFNWAIYLLSLKELVETGRGRPFPYERPINLARPARLAQAA